MRPQYWAEKMPEIQDMAQANDKDQKLPRFVPLNQSDPTLKTMVKNAASAPPGRVFGVRREGWVRGRTNSAWPEATRRRAVPSLSERVSSALN